MLAQVPNWEWARSARGIQNDYVTSVATDLMGNVYVTGYFYSDTLIFGNNDTLTREMHYYDYFFAKYDSLGNLLWVKDTKGTGGGISHDKGLSMSIDLLGNIYVAGQFSNDTVKFDNIILTNQGEGGAFIAKYDSSGKVLWAKSLNGHFHYACDIAIDYDGYLYIVGNYLRSDLLFGNDTLKSGVGGNIFIAKHDLNGNEIWATNAFGRTINYRDRIEVDANGDVYIAGNFKGQLIFENDTLINYIGSNSTDIYLAKYNANGSYLWSKKFGNYGIDEVNSICLDKDDKLIMTGRFGDTSIVFNYDTLLNTRVFTGDIFIVKLDEMGNTIWAKSFGGNGIDYGTSIITDSNRNIILAGVFGGVINIDNDMLSSSNQDIFISKFSPEGDAIWSKTCGGLGYEYVNSISMSDNQSIIIAGYFGSPMINFGIDTLYLTYNQDSYSDIFIAKLSNLTSNVNESKIGNEILIYPNPTNSNFTITIPPLTQQILITNTIGQVLQVQTINKEATQINISLVECGSYFIHVTTTDAIVTKKVFVIK